MDKEFLIERLENIIKLIVDAKEIESKGHFYYKAEGFIEALYFCDFINEAEMDAYNRAIDDAYWKR